MSSRPTFANKVDRITQAGSRINLVIADDINQLKAAIDALYAMFENVTTRTCLSIEAIDFTGPYYQNTKLIGLVPDVDFRVFTNGGAGTLLRHNEDEYDDEGGYTYDESVGRLTMPASEYSIEIYLPIIEL